MRRTLLALSLVLSFGCGSTPQPPTTPSPGVPVAAPAPAPAPAAAAPSQRSVEARANEMMDALVVVFETAGTDCEKLAAGLDGFATKYQADMKEMADFEKDLTPEQKQRWEARTKTATDKMTPSLMACAENADVQRAMERLADG